MKEAWASTRTTDAPEKLHYIKKINIGITDGIHISQRNYAFVTSKKPFTFSDKMSILILYTLVLQHEANDLII